MPSRNAPCPCGSGKKYKRCCLDREASAEDDHDAALGHLESTKELVDALDWTSFDFQVDPYDLLLDDLLAADAETKLPIVLAGSRRHITLARRLEILDELDRRSPDLPKRLHLVLETARHALADVCLQPALIGLCQQLYVGHLMEVAQRRLLDSASISRVAKRFAKDPDALIDELIDWSPSHPDAWPLMDLLLDLDEAPGGLGPMIAFARRHPGYRAAHWLFIAGDLATGDEHEAIAEALRSMPDPARHTAWQIVEGPSHHHTARADAYDLLMSLGERDLFRLLFAELARPERWDEPTDDPRHIARLLAEIGDHRAIGHTIVVLHRNTLTEAARDAVAAEFQANGWWDEIKKGLDALTLGTIELIPEGMESKEYFARALQKRPLRSREAVDGELGLLQERWNKSFHEEISWMRPEDLLDLGPVEREMMAAFAATLRDLKSPDELAERQGRWMVTPLADGRQPLVAIHVERMARSRHRWREIETARERASDLYFMARDLVEAGDRRSARPMLQAALSLMPEHPFARRALERIDA